jgi:uncharacterized protein YecT (DUF1311 family)
MKSYPRLLISVTIVIASTANSFADCSNISQQQPMNVCAGDEARASDRRLNGLYGDLVKLMGDKARSKLKDAQKAWIIYRDRSCELDAFSVEGGSMHPFVTAVCYKDLTEERIKRLKYYLTCEGAGDATCAR